MRLRHVAGQDDIVNQHPLVNQEPEKYKGRWNEFFGNSNPIHIEIGMGKGDFMIANSKKYPNVNFIGFEKFSGVLLRAVRKVDTIEDEMSNLCFLRLDAIYLLEIFAPGEVSKVYLNFSDPWIKERKAKHRLTHRKFLDIYNVILEDSGLIQFKSDNDMLYEFSLEEVVDSAFKINETTTDLHYSAYLEGNIMTEYETKFVGLGKNINYLVLGKK